VALVRHRPGSATLVGLALLFALQSLLALGFLVGRLSGPRARVVLVAGAAGLAAIGGRAIAVNLSRPHFEGYALIIGAALILQGLLTFWSVCTRRPPSIGRTAPIW
jgi:hypothetical protein